MQAPQFFSPTSPTGVRRMIMSMIRVRSLLSVSLVCKSWHEIEKWTNDAIKNNQECKRITQVYSQVKDDLSCFLNPVEEVSSPVTTLSINWSDE